MNTSDKSHFEYDEYGRCLFYKHRNGYWSRMTYEKVTNPNHVKTTPLTVVHKYSSLYKK